MTIDYRRICVPKEIDSRPIVNSPIKREGSVYMTNGHMAFRFDASMPFDPPIPEAIEATEKHIGILTNLFSGVEKLEFDRIPKFDPPADTGKCRVCRGRGLAAICTECGGARVTVCDHCGSKIDCHSCTDGVVADNEAPQVRCEPCRGSGVIEPPDSQTKFGNTWINYRYLVTVLRFNNVRVAFDLDPTEAIKFYFDGGHAVVMPMRGD